MTVFNNVAFGLRVKPITIRPSRREVRARVFELLNLVQLAAFADRYPSQLSGGQRQRVAIARALATKPEIVLADEPTANLDSKTGHSILELMKKMNAELNTTFIFSTHDMNIMSVADHVIRLLDGLVVEDSRTKAAAGGRP